jgi:hypothetical protein
MGIYEKFINFEVVVNVKTQQEYKEFCDRCAKKGLSDINSFRRISFINLHMSAGMLRIPIGNCAIEYQPYQGFTMGNIENYIKYGLEVISVEAFLEATK